MNAAMNVPMNTSQEFHEMKTSAVLLAAGEGSRMGYVAKSLLEFRGESFLSRLLGSLRDAAVHSISVVTGFHQQAIEADVQAFINRDKAHHAQLIKILRNPSPEQGPQSSVKLALESIEKDSDRVVIALADQPLINAHDLVELFNAFENRPVGTEILYPVVLGSRGNPVILSGQALKHYLTLSDSMSCRKFIDTHPALVHQYQTNNHHFITDIDTPEDYRKLQSS